MNCEGEDLEEGKVMKCALCGSPGNDDGKLLRCANCHIARYCGKACQREHWKVHKRICKRRTAELKDEQLFKQPMSNHLGDCPICYLPIPVRESRQDPLSYSLYTCCMTMVCNGCIYFKNEYDLNRRLTPSCPFCRALLSNSEEKMIEDVEKRAADGSPLAIWRLGRLKIHDGDVAGALDCWHKAAKLGSVAAHYELSIAYNVRLEGHVVVHNNRERFQYHSEQAAMGGHPVARYNLGLNEMLDGNTDRALRHLTIAARQGSLGALSMLEKCPLFSEQEYNAVYREHQEAMKKMESHQRNVADEN